MWEQSVVLIWKAFRSSSETKESKEKQCFHYSSVIHVRMTYLFYTDHLLMKHGLMGVEGEGGSSHMEADVFQMDSVVFSDTVLQQQTDLQYYNTVISHPAAHVTFMFSRVKCPNSTRLHVKFSLSLVGLIVTFTWKAWNSLVPTLCEFNTLVSSNELHLLLWIISEFM